MNSKIVNLLTNKWFHVIVSFILTLLIILQEVVLLSNPINPFVGLAFSAVFGLFYEFFHMLATSKKYSIINVLPWIGGGFVACLIMLIF